MSDLPSREPQPVEVPIDGVLTGLLLLPQRAAGLVLFVHGGGGNKYSRRNRAVASVLNRGRIATLLFDLLTLEEQEIDGQTQEIRFDIPLLAGRVVRVVDWMAADERTAGLPIGLFGAGSGAGAALAAAAERSREVRAVVCRGGRPDLAGAALASVVTPTLLLVGGLDPEVLRLNREAVPRMPAEPRLEVIPGATHLFEEAGKLDEVALQARDWFLAHFEQRES